MASHELKTPITSLKGFTQLLQRRLNDHPNPQVHVFLGRMTTQLDRLTHLITELLDISKMESGNLSYQETLVDAGALVREIVENVQAATETHRLLLDGTTPVFVQGDRDRLSQVLVNLLTNAIKYSPGADQIHIHMHATEQAVEIAVQDFGIGIAPEHQERIFDRFYQVTEAGNTLYPGLGIGLFIARTIVERHGGRLWVESQLGTGSTFRLQVPRASR